MSTGATAPTAPPEPGAARLGTPEPEHAVALPVPPAPTSPTPARPGSPSAGPAWEAGPSEGASQARPAPRCSGCARGDFAPARPDQPAVTSPEAAAELVVATLAGRDRERCVALLLDTKHRLLDLVTISVGSLDHTFMSPREVYRDALLANASALVLAHNHPSGDPEPSRDDEALTRRLSRAGELVGVELLDHLVVGGRRWVSLARRGVA